MEVGGEIGMECVGMSKGLCMCWGVWIRWELGFRLLDWLKRIFGLEVLLGVRKNRKWWEGGNLGMLGMGLGSWGDMVW